MTFITGAIIPRPPPHRMAMKITQTIEAARRPRYGRKYRNERKKFFMAFPEKRGIYTSQTPQKSIREPHL